MGQADEQRSPHTGLVVFMGMGLRRPMGMEVDVHFIAMAMQMGVDAPFAMLPENLNPEDDENDADQQLR